MQKCTISLRDVRVEVHHLMSTITDADCLFKCQFICVYWAMKPSSVATKADAQGFAQCFHPILGDVLLHECLLYRLGLLMKYTWAFFRISLTSVKCETCFSNWRMRCWSVLIDADLATPMLLRF